VDECHRGSANEEGSWRGILDYFESATQKELDALIPSVLAKAFAGEL
jgi:type I site-specific restriction endonuclease